MSHARLAGSCRALYVFDVGRRIDLGHAVRTLRESRTSSFQHKSGIPFRQEAPPVRLPWDVESRALGDFATDDRAEVSLYAQGVVCVGWRVPFDAPLEDLVALSVELYDRAELIARSREVVDQVVATIADSVEGAGTSGLVEDYVVFQVAPVADTEAFLAERRGELAQLLRAEREPLAQQEVDDATARPVSYQRDDLCLVDWLAAFLMGDDTRDELQVLEFATAELLLLRALDVRLDAGIAEAHRLLARRRSPLHLLGGGTRDLERIARLQADDALLNEGIENALKIVGDDYLARLYRASADRFHLEDWGRTIARKLDVLRNVQESTAGLTAHRRSEALEWIIIVLIAVDIAIYFV